MADVRILLVAREGEARDAYEAALEQLGVEFDAVATFGDVPSLAGDKAYNGLLIDILTLVRARKEEKAIAYECINYYPSTRIKWNAAAARITLLSLEQMALSENESALQTFIDERCRPFPARTVRRYTRKDLVLNARLFRDETTLGQEGFKTFTLNVSRGGAFVHTVEQFSRGDLIWVCFEELFDKAPVGAEVCWQQPWGVRKAVAGIGVRFTSLSVSQEAELKRLLKH